MRYIRGMLLAIDIGNTDTVIGVFDGERLLDHFRIASRDNITVDECGFFITGIIERFNGTTKDIDRIVMASVVPRLTPVYLKMWKKYIGIEPIVVSHTLKLPVKIAYDNPAAVGADRIANAVGGFMKFGGPLVVVDFGTTTNFDVVDAKGVYLGGVLAPGPVTSGAELAKRAAKLFEVLVEAPPKVIGSNTADSIKAGLFHGTVGLIDHLIELIAGELGAKPKVIATGGLAADFEKYSKYIESTHPTLTLDGLRIIAEYQSSR